MKCLICDKEVIKSKPHIECLGYHFHSECVDDLVPFPQLPLKADTGERSRRRIKWIADVQEKLKEIIFKSNPQ